MQCAVEHWNDAKPCACALVVWDERLLLVRRAIAPWEGRWDIPGGFCEPWEHPADTAIRETREEAGLEIEIIGFLGHWYADYPDAPGSTGRVTLGAYFNAITSRPETLHVGPESSEAAWFAVAELPAEIAYPEQQVPVLRVWKQALSEGTLRTPLLDWDRSSTNFANPS